MKHFALPCIVMMTLVLGVLAADRPAMADGAVALAQPADVAKAGVAIGISNNFENKNAAHEAALEKCRANPDAPAETKSLCKVVANLKDQCAAVAIDKKAGTLGFGWAIGIDKETAQTVAMINCKATAGRGRQAHCVHSISFCDGTASKP